VSPALYFLIAALCWVFFAYKIGLHLYQEQWGLDNEDYLMAVVCGMFAAVFWPLAFVAWGILWFVKRSIEAIDREGTE
jgi:membrane protease YdiL (CAAX protease family)